MTAIAFRPVQSGDGPFLLTLYASTRLAELEALPWSTDQKQAFLQMQLTAQTHHYQAHFPHAQHLIILSGGDPAGRIYVDRRPDCIHILDITVLPTYRNHGIGTAILKDLLAEAAGGGQSAQIHVESFSPSIRLFERLGFVPAPANGIHLLLRWQPGQSGDQVVR